MAQGDAAANRDVLVQFAEQLPSAYRDTLLELGEVTRSGPPE